MHYAARGALENLIEVWKVDTLPLPRKRWKTLIPVGAPMAFAPFSGSKVVHPLSDVEYAHATSRKP